MIHRRHVWFEDEGDLHVFVPGLMATGILVSIGMLVWDALKKLLPDFGRRQKAATLAVQASGRVSDLTSVERGRRPTASRVGRIRRARLPSLAFAGAAFAASTLSLIATLEAYNADKGTLAGRGWTLSTGSLIAIVFAASGGVWLLSALLGDRQPPWLRRWHGRWPIGVLPDPRERRATSGSDA